MKLYDIYYTANTETSKLDDVFHGSSYDYNNTMNELTDYLIKLFGSGFELKINKIIVRYGK